MVAMALALVLAVSGVVFAMAHGQHNGLFAVVICTEGGSATLLVDADGEPAQPTPPCPECIAPIAALLPDAPTPEPRATGAGRLALPRAEAVTDRPEPRPRARAPPAVSV